jgi:hypothetical protein
MNINMISLKMDDYGVEQIVAILSTRQALMLSL